MKFLLYATAFFCFSITQITISNAVNKPLPKYGYLKKGEANLRKGPTKEHLILYTYKKKSMPMRIIEKYENWYKVQDNEGVEGWMSSRLIGFKNKAALINVPIKIMYDDKEIDATPIAKLEKERIVYLDECVAKWCYAKIYDKDKLYQGWLTKEGLWGVDSNDTF
jgi:SH3-like domain-containing protein